MIGQVTHLITGYYYHVTCTPPLFKMTTEKISHLMHRNTKGKQKLNRRTISEVTKKKKSNKNKPDFATFQKKLQEKLKNKTIIGEINTTLIGKQVLIKKEGHHHKIQKFID